MFDTPLQLQFCGHATLAAAHTIFVSILQYETQKKKRCAPTKHDLLNELQTISINLIVITFIVL